MATDKIYGMGQYRFNGKANSICYSQTMTTAAPDLSSVGTAYRDLICSLSSGSFEPNNDYYFSISIPKDLNYSMTLDVKLINYDAYCTGKYNTSGSTNYQLLGTEIIYPVSNDDASNIIKVAYYQTNKDDSNPITRLDEVLDLESKPTSTTTGAQKDRLYLYVVPSGDDEGQKVFYLGQEDGTYAEWTKVSYTTLSKIFTSSSDADNTVTIDFLFRPGSEFTTEEPMNAIWFNMTRTSDDYNVSQQIGNDTILGRYIDPKKVSSIQCYKLANLIPSFNIADNGAVDGNGNRLVAKFNIWGVPGTRICVDGEGMRIGPSGSFYFDAFDVTSISVAALEGYNNMFTIDYEYEKLTSTN
jgi:gamma-glutamylcyclotransferase (GGCT)/AIG2-like uncharacterized protein YtfP